jgi:hypothetical protein
MPDRLDRTKESNRAIALVCVDVLVILESMYMYQCSLFHNAPLFVGEVAVGCDEAGLRRRTVSLGRPSRTA